MSGAFLGLLILLCIVGLAIVERLFYYIAQFLYIIILIIIYTFKNKKNEKKVNNSYKNYQSNVITNLPKNMDRLLTQEEIDVWEKATGRKWIYVRPKPTQWNTNNFNTEIEKFYCERCFKRISEEEYEMNDCMCESCFTDVNYYRKEF